MNDVAKLLSRLVEWAELVIQRGYHTTERTSGLELLQADVAAARRTPVVDGPRLIDDHTEVLAQTLLRLEQARRANSDKDVLLWSQLAGLILPRVRADLADALMVRS